MRNLLKQRLFLLTILLAGFQQARSITFLDLEDLIRDVCDLELTGLPSIQQSIPWSRDLLDGIECACPLDFDKDIFFLEVVTQELTTINGPVDIKAIIDNPAYVVDLAREEEFWENLTYGEAALLNIAAFLTLKYLYPGEPGRDPIVDIQPINDLSERLLIVLDEKTEKRMRKLVGGSKYRSHGFQGEPLLGENFGSFRNRFPDPLSRYISGLVWDEIAQELRPDRAPWGPAPLAEVPAVDPIAAPVCAPVAPPRAAAVQEQPVPTDGTVEPARKRRRTAATIVDE